GPGVNGPGPGVMLSGRPQDAPTAFSFADRRTQDFDSARGLPNRSAQLSLDTSSQSPGNANSGESFIYSTPTQVTAKGGTLAKTGGGTLTLGGSNSYTGGTNVTAGTMNVSGPNDQYGLDVKLNGVVDGASKIAIAGDQPRFYSESSGGHEANVPDVTRWNAASNFGAVQPGTVVSNDPTGHVPGQDAQFLRGRLAPTAPFGFVRGESEDNTR